MSPSLSRNHLQVWILQGEINVQNIDGTDKQPFAVFVTMEYTITDIETGYSIRSIHSGLAIERGLATVTCILAKTQRQVEKWENFIVWERENFRYEISFSDFFSHFLTPIMKLNIAGLWRGPSSVIYQFCNIGQVFKPP